MVVKVCGAKGQIAFVIFIVINCSAAWEITRKRDGWIYAHDLRSEGREQRAESREQRAEGREQRAESREQSAHKICGDLHGRDDRGDYGQ